MSLDQHKETAERFLCAAIWEAAQQFDYVPERLWFGRFMRALPDDIVNRAHRADGPPPDTQAQNLRGFILATVLGRFSVGFRPGQPKPCITTGIPGRAIERWPLDRWAQYLKIWLVMESLYRRGFLTFDWPPGNPMDCGPIEMSITTKGEQQRRALEGEFFKVKGAKRIP